MLITIIGIGLFIFGMVLLFRDFDVGILVFMFGLVIIFFGIFFPVNGYKEAEVYETYDLVSLSNDSEITGHGIIFVSVDQENKYTYRYEVKDSKYSTDTAKTYEVKKIEKALEVEDINCTEPQLIVYSITAKNDMKWLGFSLYEKYEYVFYVPVGTISKEVKLK